MEKVCASPKCLEISSHKNKLTWTCHLCVQYRIQYFYILFCNTRMVKCFMITALLKLGKLATKKSFAFV